MEIFFNSKYLIEKYWMEKTEIIAKAIVVFKSAVLALKSGTNISSWPSLTLIKRLPTPGNNPNQFSKKNIKEKGKKYRKNTVFFSPRTERNRS